MNYFTRSGMADMVVTADGFDQPTGNPYPSSFVSGAPGANAGTTIPENPDPPGGSTTLINAGSGTEPTGNPYPNWVAPLVTGFTTPNAHPSGVTPVTGTPGTPPPSTPATAAPVSEPLFSSSGSGTSPFSSAPATGGGSSGGGGSSAFTDSGAQSSSAGGIPVLYLVIGVVVIIYLARKK